MIGSLGNQMVDTGPVNFSGFFSALGKLPPVVAPHENHVPAYELSPSPWHLSNHQQRLPPFAKRQKKTGKKTPGEISEKIYEFMSQKMMEMNLKYVSYIRSVRYFNQHINIPTPPRTRSVGSPGIHWRTCTWRWKLKPGTRCFNELLGFWETATWVMGT